MHHSLTLMVSLDHCGAEGLPQHQTAAPHHHWHPLLLLRTSQEQPRAPAFAAAS